MTTSGRPEVDVLVAGGGPVGLATAVEARLAGLTVRVLDPRDGPVDKACGEGLMPGTVAGLARLGVHPPGHPFVGIAYLGGGRSARASFSAGPGLGVRRTALSAALAERADALGVERARGRVGEIVATSDGVRAGGTHASWLVAADGLHSPVRHALGLDRPGRGPARFGLRRHFPLAPWTDVVEVHWAADAEAYVTPVGANEIGVAVLGSPGASFEERLTAFPQLRERLAGATPLGRTLGAGPLRQGATRRSAGRVLLVGDAAGYVDALTGEGILVGLASARAAVAALVAGRPEGYDREWRRLTRRSRLLTEAVLAAATRPAVRRLVVPAAARLPGVFGRAVDALAG